MNKVRDKISLALHQSGLWTIERVVMIARRFLEAKEHLLAGIN